MSKVVPRNIEDFEIIIRFAFEGDYKRKKPFIEEFINGKEVFFDNRYEFYPVSVLRKLYIDANDCVIKGNEIQSGLKSLICFQKRDFDEAVKKNLVARPDFEAEIIGTPLDEYNEYIESNIEVTVGDPGTPSHADLKFINPGLTEADDNNANIAIRSFSSILFKYCKIITLSDISISEEVFVDLYKDN